MNIQEKKQEFEKVLEHAQSDFSSVRTSRATPALIENITIDVYGTKTPLMQLGSITSPEPKQLLVEVWDKSVLKDVEKAIQGANLGLSVNNEGNHLRIMIPAMTEETRKQIIKTLHEKVESAKVSLRNLREKIKEEISSAQKNKEISEDEKFSLVDDLDKITREYSDKISELGKKKEEEIML